MMSNPIISNVSELLTAIDAGELHGEVGFPHSTDWDSFRWLRSYAKERGASDINRETLASLIQKAIKAHRLSYAGILGMPLAKFRKLLDTPIDHEQPDSRTDRKRISPNSIPQNADVLKLAQDINRKLGRPGFPTKKAVALEFTDGNKQKAESLLRQIRRFKHLID